MRSQSRPGCSGSKPDLWFPPGQRPLEIGPYGYAVSGAPPADDLSFLAVLSRRPPPFGLICRLLRGHVDLWRLLLSRALARLGVAPVRQGRTPRRQPHPQLPTLLSLALLALALTLPGCVTGSPRPASKATQRPYAIKGETYRPLASARGFSEECRASWYEPGWFFGRTTANGERLRSGELTCAHKLLPMNTMLRVTNLENGRQIVVRVNDRGPFVPGRCIDLTPAGAKALGFYGKGSALVQVAVEGDMPGLASGAAARGDRPAVHGPIGPDAAPGDGVDRRAETPSPAPLTPGRAQAPPSGQDSLEALYEALPGPFYVQAGAFSRRENAQVLADRLVRQGYAQSRVLEGWQTGQRLWRVQAGIFPGLDQARAAREVLSREFPDAFVIAQ